MKIAIARDEAFNFTYRANIDALRMMGDIIFFSPLRDNEMPQCDMLYLPGGYPELFAEQLSANTSMRESIFAFAESGGRIFAECGGFMFLCKDIDGKAMCGVFPMQATMANAHLHLGYRSQEGTKGHEFHYSEIKECDLPDSIIISRKQLSAKGKSVSTATYHYKNVTAGYTHWYWGDKEKIELEVFFNIT